VGGCGGRCDRKTGPFPGGACSVMLQGGQVFNAGNTSVSAPTMAAQELGRRLFRRETLLQGAAAIAKPMVTDGLRWARGGTAPTRECCDDSTRHRRNTSRR